MEINRNFKNMLKHDGLHVISVSKLYQKMKKPFFNMDKLTTKLLLKL